MSNLQPFEESEITGIPSAALAVMGKPLVGDTVTLIANALSPIVYAVTLADVAAPDPLGSVASHFAAQIAASSIYAQLVIPSYAPALQNPYPGAAAPNATLILQALTATAFTVAASFSGQTQFVPIQQGTLPSPSTTFNEYGTMPLPLNGYVPICDYLEGKLATPSDLSKFTAVKNVIFRQDELQIRKAVYSTWRKRLAEFLGVPLFPVPAVGRAGGNGTGLTI
jgi:hypothetical protein